MLNCFSRRVLCTLFAAVSLLQAPHALAASNAVSLSAATAANTAFPQTSVGSSSAAQLLQLQLSSALAISSIAVQQSASSKQEFVVGAVTGCTVDGTTVNASGSTCTVSVTFTPGFSGLRQQPLVVTDSTGVTYAFGLSGIGLGPQTVLLPASVTTTSGQGSTTATTPSPDNVLASAGVIYAPEGIYVDSSNNIYIADSSHNRIRVIYQAGAALACLIEVEQPAFFGLATGATSCAGATSAPTAGFIYTLAGNGTASFSGDAGLATSATINAPGTVKVDASGNLYIGDVSNFRIRMVYAGGTAAACLIELQNPTAFGLSAGATTCTGATSAPVVGYIYTLTGTGTTGFSGDGAIASAAKIAAPYGVALSPAGDIFIAADSATAGIGSHIRVIYNGGAPAAALIALESPGTVPVIGNIYSVLGTTTVVSTGDGALASAAGMLYAYGLFVDPLGNVYFPDKTSGTSPTVAKVRVIYNSGTTLANLISLENSGITAIPGFVYTIAGNATVATAAAPTTLVEGVLATQSSLGGAYDLTVDAAGDIYLAERLSFTIRKISATTGIIQTIAGVPFKQGTPGGQSTNVFGAPAIAAELWGPWGIALDSVGGLYFTDNASNRLRNNSGAAGTVTFATTAVGSTSASQAIIANNIGNANLTISTVGATTNYAVTPPAGITGYSDCAAGTLAPGAACSIGLTFSPTTGGTITGTATVTDNSLNGTAVKHTASLTGTAGTFTAITSSPAAPTYGQQITLTATVTYAGAPVTSGSVVFLVGATTLGTVPVDTTTGVASLTTTLLPAGTDAITTTYAANGTYGASNGSASIVVGTATLTVTADNQSRNAGTANPTFTYSVTGYQNTDTAAILTGAPLFSTTATSTSPVGTYPITITKNTLSAGSNYTLALVNGTLTVTTAGSQTISFNSIANVAYGSAPFTVTATSNAGQPVTISIVSGSNVSLSGSTALLINGTVTINGAGPVTLQANAPGNSSFPAATPVNQSFTVTPAALAVKANAVTYTYGAPTALSGTVTGAIGSDSFTETFTTNAPTGVTPVPVGTYTITPAVTGNGTTSAANYTITTTTATLTVKKATTTTTLTTSNANATLGASITFTATTLPSTSGTPTGTVTLTADGTNVLGTTALTSAGTATFTVNTLTAGTHTIVAAYGGDTNFSSSSSSSTSQIISTPAFSVTYTPIGIAIQRGANGIVNLSVASVGGYAQTITPSCPNIPTGLSCFFSPGTLVFTGANDTKTLSITISSFTTSAAVRSATNHLSIINALSFWIPGSLVGLFGLRRRNRLAGWQRTSLLMLALFGGLIAAGSVTGCGSGPNQSIYAPYGTYNVPISLTDGTTTYNTSVTVSILGGSSVQ